MSSAKSLAEIMSIVHDGACALVGADRISFILRDGAQCRHSEGSALDAVWDGKLHSLDDCVEGAAILCQETMIVDDLDADPSPLLSIYRGSFARSLAVAPVRNDERSGAIGAYWAAADGPDEHSIKCLQRIANAAAMAMTNVALINSLAAAREESQRARDAMILALAALAEARDHETGNHIRRTQHYVRALAEATREQPHYAEQLTDDLIDLLYKSAPLHDIGKVGIPDRILLKPGRLDRAEFEVMKTHAEIGHAAITTAEHHMGSSTPFLALAKQIAYTHHERWDGSGYPQGLKGEEIPICGRIMAIADVYDALVSARVYKAAMPHQDAVDLIIRESGTHFDPALIAIFAKIAPVFEGIHRQFADECLGLTA